MRLRAVDRDTAMKLKLIDRDTQIAPQDLPTNEEVLGGTCFCDSRAFSEKIA